MQNEKCHEPDMQATYLITDNDEVNLSIQKKNSFTNSDRTSEPIIIFNL